MKTMSSIQTGTIQIPLAWIGPIAILWNGEAIEQKVPLATLEYPLWASIGRGAKISRLCGGIECVIHRNCMTRSILVQGTSVKHCHSIQKEIELNAIDFQALVNTVSSHTKVMGFHTEVVGNLLFIRFTFETGSASGHNMTTKASEVLGIELLKKFPGLRFVSLSGNFCTDKKVSSVNGILGRGKHVTAELVVPREICLETLHTTPEQIVSINTKKNLIGSMIAGSVRSGNAHVANTLAAMYLATGQDVANIVEGSQAITFAELVDGNLYFALSLPNLVVGTIGNGKELAHIEENLRLLGCNDSNGAEKLAVLIGAASLCSELSLLGALTNPTELMKSHLLMERNHG